LTDPTGEKWKWWQWALLGVGILDPVSTITTATVVGGTATAIAAATVTAASTLLLTDVTDPVTTSATSSVFSNTAAFADFLVTFFGSMFRTLYLTKVAMPSFLSYQLGSKDYHNNSWYEVWANKLGKVPESDLSPNKYRYNVHWGHYFWYWPLAFGLPFFPH